MHKELNIGLSVLSPDQFFLPLFTSSLMNVVAGLWQDVVDCHFFVGGVLAGGLLLLLVVLGWVGNIEHLHVLADYTEGAISMEHLVLVPYMVP